MEENNRHILIKAIKSLPGFKLPVWLGFSFIENKIKKKPSITDSRLNLPEHKAPDFLWDKIENELIKDNLYSTDKKSSFSRLANRKQETHDHLNENNPGNPQSRYWQDEEFSDKRNAENGIFLPMLDNAKQQLPIYTAPDKVWPKIEAELRAKKKWLFQGLLKYAGLIIVLITSLAALFYFNRDYKFQENLKHTVETVPVYEEAVIEHFETGISGNLCKHNPVACNKQEYLELSTKLENIKKEINKLKSILNTSPGPQVLKYIYMLENQKAEIEKRMLRIVLNT